MKAEVSHLKDEIEELKKKPTTQGRMEMADADPYNSAPVRPIDTIEGVQPPDMLRDRVNETYATDRSPVDEIIIPPSSRTVTAPMADTQLWDGGSLENPLLGSSSVYDQGSGAWQAVTSPRATSKRGRRDSFDFGAPQTQKQAKVDPTGN